MKTFIKIAWRNIVRNKYRSAITIMAIAFGLAALIFIRAFVEGGHRQMVGNYTDLVTGHLQVHILGFQEKMGLERSINNPDEMLKIIKGTPNVVEVAQRIKEFVLIGSTEHSAGVLLVGVDPINEPKVTYLYKRIHKGNPLSVDRDDQIVIGKDLADILNVGLEDKVVIMAQAVDGSLAGGAYHVCGIMESGAEEIDKRMVLITLKAANQLLLLDKKISEFAIRLDAVDKVEIASKELKRKIDTSKFEVLTWKEISPVTAEWIEFDWVFVNFILFVVLIIVASGIFNTILMSVLERLREFGIMLALGTKKKQIIFMVGIESAILGLFGVVLGSILGHIVSIYFGYIGIDLSFAATAFEAYYTGAIIYPRLVIGYTFLFSLIVLLVSIAVSLYPAWKAANLKPIEAIYHF